MEKLKKNNFVDDELIMIENTLIKNLLSSKDSSLIIECLKSYQYFMYYIYNKFCDNEYLKSTLQMLTNFCNLKEYNEEICKISIHRISDVVLLSYEYMENLINNIIEFFGMICNHENENIGIQGYIFLIELSQDEYNRICNGKICKNYIDSCWGIIWPIIQNTLNNEINNENNESDRYKSLSDLLYYISKICNENIIDDIFIYMREKMSSKNPSLINSSIYLFSSILESVHRKKLKTVINSCIETLCELFKLKNENLNETISWCIENICENFGELIIRSPDIFQIIINLILENLKNKEMSNKIKIYLCTSLYKIADIAKKTDLIRLGIFNPYLLDLLTTLDNLAYLPNSYSVENNLPNYCFMAISGLIKCTQEQNNEILKLYIEQLLHRFDEACYLKNFLNNKQYQNEIQDSLCIVIESFCEKNELNNNKFTYKQIEAFFTYI
jgi:hypothetical protein